MRKKKKKELDTQGCLHLLEALVKAASQDYLRSPEDSRVHKEAEQFFKSQYFFDLTGHDGRLILKRLDKQRKEGKKNV